MKLRCASIRLSLVILVVASLTAACDDDDSDGVTLLLDASTGDSGGTAELDGGATDTAPDSSQSDVSQPAPDASSEDASAPSPDASMPDISAPDTGGGEDCTFTADPALAAGESSDMSGATATHNKWRERVGVARVQYNTTLANAAKSYAERCVWEHSGRNERSAGSGFGSVGENLAYTSQRLADYGGVQRAVEAWVEERYDWDFGMVIGDGNFAAYGHYTQVVWSSTTDIGCGAAYCDNIQGIGRGGTMIVCRYGPAGNYRGRAPYGENTGACLDLDNDDVLQSSDADDTDRSVQ